MSSTVADESDSDIITRLREGGPPVHTWDRCDPAEAPERQDLVEDLIPGRGTSLLVGKPKSGKSQFLGHLSACLMADCPLFGRYDVADSNDVRILWILTEETRYDVRDRVESNLRGLGLDESEITETNERITAEERIIVSADDTSAVRPAADRRFQLERHHTWIEEHARDDRLTVVILDSLRAAHQRDENSSTDIQPVTQLFRNLAGPVCFIPVHHEGHRGNDTRRTGGAAARGSSDLDAARDTAIHLRQGQFGATMVFGFDHRRSEDRFVVVRTDIYEDSTKSAYTWTFVGETEDESDVSQLWRREPILKHVDDAKRPEELPSSTDLKKAVGDSYKSIVRDLELEWRDLNLPGPGAPQRVVARPGQFPDEEWEEAESE